MQPRKHQLRWQFLFRLFQDDDYAPPEFAGGFDALVTADVKHNVFIDAIAAGISLFDAGHYETEKVVCTPLADKLSTQFPDISFEVYNHERIKSI